MSERAAPARRGPPRAPCPRAHGRCGERIARQHAAGKLTAFERVEELIDAAGVAPPAPEL
ncbi:MAG: hypothetical protein H0V26_06965 [Solirubrobacterales bacterium]|nr:hypothetical protein [Solirubrobacterales bacterium]